MPHTPKIYNGDLYLLISGTGELVKVDPATGKYDIIRQLNGFARGMDIVGDYLVIGLSKLRTTSKAFQDLPVSQRSIFAGVVIVYLPSGSIYGFIKYENSVDEIYDVKILPGTIRPGLLNTQRPEFRRAVSLPDHQFWAVSREQDESDTVKKEYENSLEPVALVVQFTCQAMDFEKKVEKKNP